MYIILPNANGKLFLSNTIIACDDPEQACTEFRFLIMNTGSVTANAWYKVSIVGGGTLYSDTVPNLAPQVGSSYIDDWICALPGGLPVGTHTVKVEVGVEGSATATDTYTEDIYVIEEVSFVTEEITTQFSYGGQDYPLESASIHVIDWDTNGSLYNETCYSHWLQVNYGCDFAFLEESVEYEAAASKDGYHTNSLRFIAEGSYVELWLTPREPTVVTEDASLITPTSAQLNGLITDMDGLDSVGFHFTYWPSGGSQTNTHTSYPTGTSAHASGITGLLPATIYYFQAVTINETEEADFYVNGTTKQFTTLEESLIPTIVTIGASQIDNTTIELEGELTLMAEANECDVYFRYGNDASCVYSSKEFGVFDTLTTPSTYQLQIGSLAPSATIYYAAAAECPGYDTSFGEVKVITLIEGTSPSGIYTTAENYENVCGAEIANNCISADIFVEHFGSDNECSVYLEYWSEGDTEHNFTTPIVVPYDPLYEEYGGFEIQGVTACIPDCEKAAHIRAVASNSVGTSYGEVVTPITVRLEAPTEITQTSVTLNAYIVTMGTITTGIALFRYGTPNPDTYDYPQIAISSVGAISRTITGLVPNTTYQYSLLARNQYGYPQTSSTTTSFTTLPETIYNMSIVLPNENGKLFLNNTVIASDDPEQACTEFRFLIMNTGSVTANAWYTVSIIGGYTLYSGTVQNLAPGVESSYIDNHVCAFSGDLPLGTHTIKVEAGPEGQAATDSYTEDIYVIEEPVPPQVYTDSAEGITPTSAELWGYLATTGGIPTYYGFEYGKTTSYGTTIGFELETTNTGYFHEVISNLDPDTLYHFRAKATNANGTRYGVDMPFTTLEGLFDITFIATALGISDLHDVDVNDVTDPQNPLYLGKT